MMRLLPTFLLGVLILAVHILRAQAKADEAPIKYDVVLMNNGDQKSGKVTEVLDDKITFIYANETLAYSLKKSDINKITFASGRIEFFKPQPGGTTSATDKTTDFHNKVAILPFAYILNQKNEAPEMHLKIQQQCYSIIKKRAQTIVLQDVAKTNALLIKAGVNDNNIQGYTMGEICHILDVEYVLQGMVTINETGESSSSVGTTDTKVKGGSNTLIGKILSTSSASTYSEKRFQTNVVMNIYDYTGQQLFTQDHDSFWPAIDAYDVTLNYLLKKTPIYGK